MPEPNSPDLEKALKLLMVLAGWAVASGVVLAVLAAGWLWRHVTIAWR